MVHGLNQFRAGTRVVVTAPLQALVAAHLPEVLVDKKGVVYWDWVGKPYCVAIKMDLINVHAPDGYVRIYWLKCEWLSVDTNYKIDAIAPTIPSYSFAVIKDELAHFHATIGAQQDMINDLKDEVEDLKAMLKGVLGIE